jgi:hypothetical protein
MVEPLRHRQTKEAGTDMFDPKATASHLDSTRSGKAQTEQMFSGLCLKAHARRLWYTP